MVFQHVPGNRLADDQGAPVPGYSLHMFFQKLERAERNKFAMSSTRITLGWRS
jgi:hypothetical protein